MRPINVNQIEAFAGASRDEAGQGMLRRLLLLALGNRLGRFFQCDAGIMVKAAFHIAHRRFCGTPLAMFDAAFPRINAGQRNFAIRDSRPIFDDVASGTTFKRSDFQDFFGLFLIKDALPHGDIDRKPIARECVSGVLGRWARI